MGWLHFSPGSTFSPYLYAGVGQFWYERTAEGEAGVPNNETQHTIHIPVGIGGEWAFSKAGAFNFELGARIMDRRPTSSRMAARSPRSAWTGIPPRALVLPCTSAAVTTMTMTATA